MIAEVARVLVSGGVSVYRLQPVQASLESWFLQVTSRLGDCNEPGADAAGLALRRPSSGRPPGLAVPTGAMIATRVHGAAQAPRPDDHPGAGETSVSPRCFLGIRLLLHAIAPKTYGPAGGYDIYTAMSAGVLYTFGFIVAATLGCTAGSVDLSEGMFRHLVITGRSRLALYLARIPPGWRSSSRWSRSASPSSAPCASSPLRLSYDGVTVPAGLSQSGLENWAASRAGPVICSLPYTGHIPGNTPCAGPPGWSKSAITPAQPAPSAAEEALAIKIAKRDVPGYTAIRRSPPILLMIKTGLWLT